MTSAQTVRVAVPLFLPKLLDYVWQGTGAPSIGQVVVVEVGKQPVHGLVMAINMAAEVSKLKPATPLENTSIPAVMAKFYQWVSRYTLSSPGDPIRAAWGGKMLPERPEPVQQLVAGDAAQELKLTAKRQQVLALAGQGHSSVAALARQAKVSSGVVQGLLEAGALAWQEVPQHAPEFTLDLLPLNTDQQHAATTIAESLGQFKPFLLDGVTGSGKTEVYFASIAAAMAADEAAQTLVLVPEIALTPQWLQRFEARFEVAPHVWHSGVSAGEKRRTWWAVRDGVAKVVIGARSALFLPFNNLRLVVVDEEHDPSYKQEEGFRYHGRDMAVVLANHWLCPAVLASATPSLESWHNAQQGRYQHLVLQHRYGKAQLPSMALVDMRQATLAPGTFISPEVAKILADTLAAKQQSLVFLNRRGVAPLLLCAGCGHRWDCPDCSASLVVHGNRLTCHHCGFSEQYPEQCTACGEAELRVYGPGTRGLMQELSTLFPQARLAVADSDALTSPAAMQELMDKITAGRVDIVVGTQMVAKGHHFPNLTTVAVIDADMGLAQGDIRAAERTFQLLTQVAGRAGRAAAAGQVLLQTHDPEHPLMQSLVHLDREGLYAQELDWRQQWGDPPFGRLAAVVVSGPDERMVAKTARQLAQAFVPAGEAFSLLGPAPAPLTKLRGQYRYRLLLKGQGALQNTVQAWLNGVVVPRSTRVVVDMDPQSFF